MNIHVLLFVGHEGCSRRLDQLELVIGSSTQDACKYSAEDWKTEE